MSPQEKLRRHILTSQRCNPTGQVFYRTIQRSIDFGIPDPHVREVLAEMADQSLISLVAWGGNAERAIADWSDPKVFLTHR